MNEQMTSYHKEFLGEFTPDQRSIALHDRLKKYYADTPDSMSNQAATPLWIYFNRWCKRKGYTREEINNAKRQNYDH